MRRILGKLGASVALALIVVSQARTSLCQPGQSDASLLPARTVRFPDESEIGLYALIDGVNDWPYPRGGFDGGEARGEVQVLEGKLVSLTVDPDELHLLTSLRPDAVQYLVLSTGYGGDVVSWTPLNAIEHLSDLRGLTLRGNTYSPLYGYTSNGEKAIFREQDVAPLAKLRSLRQLDLQLTEFPPEALGHLAALPDLETLVLDWSNMTDEGLVHVGRIKSLRRLSLVSTGVSATGLAHLAGLAHLESIDLSESPVTAEGLVQLTHLVALRELTPGPLEGHCEALDQLANFRSLERLNLQLSSVRDGDLQRLRLPWTLKVFRIQSEEPITDAGIVGLANVKDLEALFLDLPTRLSGRGLEALCGLERFTSLSINIASATDDGLAGLRALSRLERLAVRLESDAPDLADFFVAIDGHPNLTELFVTGGVTQGKPVPLLKFGLPRLRLLSGGMAYNQEWASRIAAGLIGQLTALEELNLASMHVSNAQLQRLENLSQLTNLTLNAQISEAGFASVGRLTRLEQLDIRQADMVTDEGLRYLAGLAALQTLSMTSSSGEVTAAGIAQLRRLTKLKSLDLCNAYYVTDAMVDALAQLSQLERLNVSGTRMTAAGFEELRRALPDCQIAFVPFSGPPKRAGEPLETDADLARLKDRVHVRSIRLASKDITGAGLAHMSGLSALEGLDLSGTKITDEDLKHLAGLAQLKRLDLSHTQITDAGLAHLKGLKNLESLSLDGTNVTDVGLAHVREAKGLKTLRISGTRVTGSGLAHMSGLEELHAVGLPIDDESLVHFKNLMNLQVAYLIRTRISGAGLAHLAELKHLRELNLYDTPLVDEGLVHLGKVGSLEALVFSQTVITDEGLSHLSELSQLETLSLDGTNVTDAGLAELAGMTQLRLLRLEDTPITDDGVNLLGLLPGLERIHLRGTGITDQGERTLQTLLPDCNIIR